MQKPSHCQGIQILILFSIVKKTHEMRTSLLLCCVVAATIATPNGHYHQEYNYKTSSSSFKNNELQHKNDDQGFYSKDGDLEGVMRPKVNAHSQHSEYINPHLRDQYQANSYGQLNAQDQLRTGQAAFDNAAYNMGAGGGYRNPYGLQGASGLQGAYGQQGASGIQGAYGVQGASGIQGAYGVQGASGIQGSSANYQTYGIDSHLRQITEPLEAQMARELQQAVFEQHRRSSAYSTSAAVSQAQAESDLRILEDAIRRNLTMRLEDALQSSYGTQRDQGSYSYTISNGRLQPTANYHSQELADAKRLLETNLLQQLNQQMQSYYHTQASRSHMQTMGSSQYSPTSYPSSTQQRPINYPSPIQAPTYSRPINYPSPIQAPTYSRPINYPSPNEQRPVYYPSQQISTIESGESITALATRVQNDLNEHLNRLLDDAQRRYFSTQSRNYNQQNFGVILNQLQQQLRNNISMQFDNEMNRRGAYSTNFNQEDLQNLRRQVETNLINKLDRDFNKQKEHYFETYSTSSQSSQGYQSQPVGNQQYYGSNSYQNNVDMASLQRQLQEDMSRQVQAAISQQVGSYGSSSYNSQSNYQARLQELTAELNRNLTRQWEDLNRNQNYQSGRNSGELANMRNQLQDNLTRQLQQGLQQSFSRYSSWSSSSATSSNYRPVRGFDPNNYQNVRVGGLNNPNGEDCMMGDDPNSYQQQTQNDDDLTQQTETDDELTQQVQEPTSRHSHQYTTSHHRVYASTQHEPSTLVQRRVHYYEGMNGGYGHQEPSSSSQYLRVGPSTSYSRGTYGQYGISYQQPYGEQVTQTTESLGQKPDDSDLTQQTEDVRYSPSGSHQHVTHNTVTQSHYGKIQVGSQHNQQSQDLSQLGQQIDDSDLTQQTQEDLNQQTEDVGISSNSGRNAQINRHHQSSRLFPQQEIQNQHQHQLDQRISSQQTENLYFGSQPNKLHIGVQHQTQLGQEVDDSDLTQQTEELQSVNQQTHLEQDQQHTQQVEDLTLGSPRPFSQRKPYESQQEQTQLEQEVVDSDLTQQTQTVGSGKLQLENHNQNTQQVEDFTLERRPLSQRPRGWNQHQQTQLGQEADDSDLTQQTENVGFGTLQSGNQYHQSAQQTEDLILGSRRPFSQRKPFGGQQEQTQLGQEVDDSDLSQQTETVGIEKLQLGNHSENTQQVDLTLERQPLSHRPGGNQHQKTQLGQEADDSDLTQQTEDVGFGTLQSGNQYQQTEDLTLGSRRPFSQRKPYGSQQEQTQLGQEVDDSDLTQQTETVGSGKLQLGNHNQNTQQVEDLTLERRPLSQSPHGWNQHQETQLGQEADDSDLTQQTENVGFGTFQSGNQYQQTEDLTLGSRRPFSQRKPYGSQQEQTQLGQEVDDSDLTQQTETVGSGKLQLGNHNQNTQQVEDLTLETRPLSQSPHGWNQHQQTQLGQEADYSDLTQQTGDVGFGTLQSGNQYQQTTQQRDDLTLGSRPYTSRKPIEANQQEQAQVEQEVDDSDLALQTGNIDLSEAPGVHHQQSINHSVADNVGYGSLQIGSLSKPKPTQDNQYLAQQFEDQHLKTLADLIAPKKTGSSQLDTNTIISQQPEDLTHQPKVHDTNQRQIDDQIKQEQEALRLLREQIAQLGETHQESSGSYGSSHFQSSHGHHYQTQTNGNTINKQNQEDVTTPSEVNQKTELEEAERRSELLLEQLRLMLTQHQEAHQGSSGSYGSSHFQSSYGHHHRASYIGEASTNNENTLGTSTSNGYSNNATSSTYGKHHRASYSSDNIEQAQDQRPLQYESKPVYTNIRGQEVQVGTTRTGAGYSGLNYGSSHQVNDDTEAAEEIEGVEPQHANVLQTVAGIKTAGPVPVEVPVQTEQDIEAITTQKPGFWKKFTQGVRNKIG